MSIVLTKHFFVALKKQKSYQNATFLPFLIYTPFEPGRWV